MKVKDFQDNVIPSQSRSIRQVHFPKRNRIIITALNFNEDHTQ